MPLLSVSVTRDGGLDVAGSLGTALAELPPDAPVIAMVHGYKYDPAGAATDPHRTLFAMESQRRGRRAASWPARLGVGDGAAAEPLAIGFGWGARGSFWRAWRRSGAAALALAGLVSSLAARGRTVHLVGHSLGARVCLRALALAPEGAIGRVVLLSGAVPRHEARAALASPAGRRAEVVNVTSRENDLFDALTEALTGFADRTIGDGLPGAPSNWLDLQIDDDATRDGLDRLGYPIGPASARVCHWSCYLRPGVFALYRDLLRDPRRLPLPLLAAHVPSATQPRWSRMLARHLPGRGISRPIRSRARGTAAPEG